MDVALWTQVGNGGVESSQSRAVEKCGAYGVDGKGRMVILTGARDGERDSGSLSTIKGGGGEGVSGGVSLTIQIFEKRLTHHVSIMSCACRSSIYPWFNFH